MAEFESSTKRSDWRFSLIDSPACPTLRIPLKPDGMPSEEAMPTAKCWAVWTRGRPYSVVIRLPQYYLATGQPLTIAAWVL